MFMRITVAEDWYISDYWINPLHVVSVEQDGRITVIRMVNGQKVNTPTPTDEVIRALEEALE